MSQSNNNFTSNNDEFIPETKKRYRTDDEELISEQPPEKTSLDTINQPENLEKKHFVQPDYEFLKYHNRCEKTPPFGNRGHYVQMGVIGILMDNDCNYVFY